MEVFWAGLGIAAILTAWSLVIYVIKKGNKHGRKK